VSQAILNSVRELEKRLSELEKRLLLQAEETDWLKSEIHRLQGAKRPDRPPIRVPKMPRALQSIGVGLLKE